MQIGKSAGPECKAALQETTKLVENRLATNKEQLKSLFNAADVCSVPFLLFSCNCKLYFGPKHSLACEPLPLFCSSKLMVTSCIFWQMLLL